MCCRRSVAKKRLKRISDVRIAAGVMRSICVCCSVFVAVYVLQCMCCSVCVCCRGCVVKEKMKEISDMKIAAKIVRSMRVCCSVCVAVCVAVYVS